MKKEMVSKILNKVKKDYSETAKVRQKIWPEEKSLIKLIKNSDTVLDLGCGQGRIIPLLQNKKINYLGLDNCTPLIKNAQGKFPNYKFINQDITKLDLPKKSFDKIISLATLHHIPSRNLRLKILKDIRKLLVDDGMLLMTNWDLSNFKRKEKANDLEEGDYYIPWRKKKDIIMRYYHNISKREMEESLKKAGFKIMSNKKGPRNLVTIAKS